MLEIVIPVYNEGASILSVLAELERHVRTPSRVLVCYDSESDDTLEVLRVAYRGSLEVRLVKNPGRGPHAAVLAGFAATTAPYIVVYPADDLDNARMLDEMVARGESGAAIVCASRFISGGSMKNCPALKAFFVRSSAFTLHHLARVPTHDASNGFRFFSRRVLELPCESTHGFTYSIELLAKCHRLGWPIAEVPAQWNQRLTGTSRFRVFAWLPHYLRWYGYMFGTTYLRRTAVFGYDRAARGRGPVGGSQCA
jgi:dolichol-phosphate mannosyltransferase